VGREVTSVLEAARAAAETMRDRAGADAARWRSEAMAEVEAMRKSARADAEAMRTDAWTTSSQLLEQVMAEVERTRAASERDSLAVMGEAEREAHRLTSTARREAEEVVRAAKMEAERLVTQAQADHDNIIATAHRQAEAAQERTRALEQRRQELMGELESLRPLWPRSSPNSKTVVRASAYPSRRNFPIGRWSATRTAFTRWPTGKRAIPSASSVPDATSRSRRRRRNLSPSPPMPRPWQKRWPGSGRKRLSPGCESSVPKPPEEIRTHRGSAEPEKLPRARAGGGA
jgi:vacuolar-type H+-ATPase subunit E/Vma4